jgi:hypothetical protein
MGFCFLNVSDSYKEFIRMLNTFSSRALNRVGRLKKWQSVCSLPPENSSPVVGISL